MDTTAQAVFVAHVRALETRAEAGDEDAVRSLCCMALLADGWRPQSPDDGGGEVIDLQKYRMAA